VFFGFLCFGGGFFFVLWGVGVGFFGGVLGGVFVCFFFFCFFSLFGDRVGGGGLFSPHPLPPKKRI